MSFETLQKRYSVYNELVKKTGKKRANISWWFTKHRKSVLNDEDVNEYLEKWSRGEIKVGNPNWQHKK